MVEYYPAWSEPIGKSIPQCARKFGLKNEGIPPTKIDQFERASEKPVGMPPKSHLGCDSSRFHNSLSFGILSSRRLPAIKLTLIAPIELPIIQSGSLSASYKPRHT